MGISMKMIENIVYAPWISKKMCVRFDNLKLCVGKDGILYSQSPYNDEWDFQTKALWFRCIGMTPNNIAKKLQLNTNTIKNREFFGLLTLDYPDKNFESKIPDRNDWATVGYVNLRCDRYVRHGGAPEIQQEDYDVIIKCEIYNEVLQLKRDVRDRQEEKKKTKSQQLYDEWYKND